MKPIFGRMAGRAAAAAAACSLAAGAVAGPDTATQSEEATVSNLVFEKVSDEQFLHFLKTDVRKAVCKVPQSVTALDHVQIGEPEPGFPLKADVFYKTKRPETPRPAIIFLHDWASGRNPARAGERQGSYMALVHDWVFVSLFYRPPGMGYRAPAALKDVRTCARWLRSKADEYAIMTNGIVAMGSSAGTLWAFLAAAANGTTEHDDACGFPEYSGDINLVVLLSAMADIDDKRDWGIARTIVGAPYEEAPETYRRYSVRASVRPGLPPTFMAQGEKDNSDFMIAWRDHLRQAGNDAELAIWPGAGHGGGPFPVKLRLAADFIYGRLLSSARWP